MRTFLILMTVVGLLSSCEPAQGNKEQNTPEPTAAQDTAKLSCGHLLDPAKWEMVAGEYCRDKQSQGLYYHYHPVAEFPPSFTPVKHELDGKSLQDHHFYAQDKDKVLYKYLFASDVEFHPTSADPATFVVLEDSPYAKDASHVFFLGNIVENADLGSFSVKKCSNKTWRGKDKDRYFYEGKEVEKALIEEVGCPI